MSRKWAFKFETLTLTNLFSQKKKDLKGFDCNKDSRHFFIEMMFFMFLLCFFVKRSFSQM